MFFGLRFWNLGAFGSPLVASNLPISSVGSSTFSEGKSSMAMKSLFSFAVVLSVPEGCGGDVFAVGRFYKNNAFFRLSVNQLLKKSVDHRKRLLWRNHRPVHLIFSVPPIRVGHFLVASPGFSAMAPPHFIYFAQFLEVLLARLAPYFDIIFQHFCNLRVCYLYATPTDYGCLQGILNAKKPVNTGFSKH